MTIGTTPKPSMQIECVPNSSQKSTRLEYKHLVDHLLQNFDDSLPTIAVIYFM